MTDNAAMPVTTPPKQRAKPKASIKPAGKAARPRARRLAPEERRAQIVQSAIRVFARRGIGHTNHSEVAAEAGLSLPAVFFYFDSHEALAQCVLEEVSRFLLNDVIKPLHREPGPVAEIVENTYMAFLEAIDSHSDHVRIWLDWSTAIRDSTWPQYLEFHQSACDIFRRSIERARRDGRLRKDIDAMATARVLISFGHMIAHMKLVGSSRDAIASALHSLVRGYLQPPEPASS